MCQPAGHLQRGLTASAANPSNSLMIRCRTVTSAPSWRKLGSRKAEIVNMGTRDTGVTHLEFKIPARGLMGYRQEFLSDTNGSGIMNNVFDSYRPYKGRLAEPPAGVP